MPQNAHQIIEIDENLGERCQYEESFIFIISEAPQFSENDDKHVCVYHQANNSEYRVDQPHVFDVSVEKHDASFRRKDEAQILLPAAIVLEEQYHKKPKVPESCEMTCVKTKKFFREIEFSVLSCEHKIQVLPLLKKSRSSYL